MSNDDWLSSALPKHRNLTETVVSIIKSLLENENVEFLSVSGRTKDREAIDEKIKRKKYRNPESDLTDISGIRIILFLESAVEVVSNLINRSFNIDKKNSSNKVENMSADQVGYRSVHYVCDLGNERLKLPEHINFGALKFEIQIRTVLQHAWAELSHDRNYKFKGNLPRAIERQLYLYAGMLEIADKGFSEISDQIDNYIKDIEKRSNDGDLNISLNSISLQEFFLRWAKKNNARIEDIEIKDGLSDLTNELKEFGITKIEDLNAIIPPEYAELTRSIDGTTIYGAVRDWMLISDCRRFVRDVKIKWKMDDDGEDSKILRHVLPEYDYEFVVGALTFQDSDKYEDEDYGGDPDDNF
jgi:ppGpp synthetase/RelA/SpoT-type nucleotidyltranferase